MPTEGKQNERDRKSDYAGCYGAKLGPVRLVEFLRDAFAHNARAEEKGWNRFAVCVWGHAGVGKSEIIGSFADVPVEYKGRKYDGYRVHDVPVAQLEEMGDLHGCPERCVRVLKGSEHRWVAEDVLGRWTEQGWEMDLETGARTLYAPPDWVPQEPVPTILHIEDWNRPSQRIIKGVMQLFQTFGMLSWKLPPGCHIVLSGNPDEQDYLVSSVDPAVLTRIRHVTLKEDAEAWAEWATAQGDIDPRVISWVLAKQEEMVSGHRTNPRTITDFGRWLHYQQIEDVKSKDESRRIKEMAHAMMEEVTVTSLIVFFERDVRLVVSPEDILSGRDSAFQHCDSLMSAKEPRIDIMGVICSRLYATIADPECEPDKDRVDNFQRFITSDWVPHDIRHSICRRIATQNDQQELARMGRWIVGSERLRKLVMDMMRQH